jgi:hypothetical protein
MVWLRWPRNITRLSYRIIGRNIWICQLEGIRRISHRPIHGRDAISTAPNLKRLWIITFHLDLTRISKSSNSALTDTDFFSWYYWQDDSWPWARQGHVVYVIISHRWLIHLDKKESSLSLLRGALVKKFHLSVAELYNAITKAKVGLHSDALACLTPLWASGSGP